MLKTKACFVWKGHPYSHPCPSSERENIWGCQPWNVSILSRVYSSSFLIWEGKILVNTIWKSICHRVLLYFPVFYKAARGDVQSVELLSPHIAHHHPQLFLGVLERIGCTKENEFRNRRASEFEQEKEENWSKWYGYLTPWDKHALINEYYKIFY